MPDELDPEKFHIITKERFIKCRKCLLLVAFLFFLVIPAFSYRYYDFAINRTALFAKETTFEIEEGESVGNIAERLYSDNLVNSEFLFKFYLVSSGLQSNIQAGVYDIHAGASIVELADIFQHGTNDVSITFLEGWRVEEFALEATTLFPKVDFEDFVRLARRSEGRLFPDTYYFNANVDEDEMVATLKENFVNKTEDVLTEQALANAGLSVEEVLTFASIVEREVNNEDDRPVVAGILINRWRNGELIGADATTQYAIALRGICSDALAVLASECVPTKEEAMEVEWWPNRLTIEDLDNPSLYNTREVVGLPPSPIANPGISSMEAVLNYEQTSYNYYLTDSEGITRYAETLEQHNANVARYL